MRRRHLARSDRQRRTRLAVAGTLSLIIVSAVMISSLVSALAASAKVEAESGTRGAEYAVGNDGAVAYIYPTTNSAGTNPGSAARVVTYSGVTFPAAGNYDLYVRVWVGPGGGDDDSFFVGNGFGTKSVTNNANWLAFNNLGSVGFTADNDIVTGEGSAGTQVWKWINLSQRGTVVTFTVPGGALTQTFQIGAREDGLFIDAFVFGSSGYQFTVADLNAGGPGNPPPPPPPPVSNVDWNDARQRIDGFGASSAWRSNWTAAQADMFFTDKEGTAQSNSGSSFAFRGIGLSMLRSRIAPDGTSVETNIMQMAQARGAKVWSSPWSPPIQYKDSGTVNGGNFVSSDLNYQGYADQLANYVQSMKNTYGIDLYAISVQNEPTQSVSYESCVWTAQQIHEFVPYLYDALATRGLSSTKILLPENAGWSFALAADTMNDPASAAQVGVLAGHDYGTPPVPVNNYGKPLWETECSLLGGSDSSISNGVYWARKIHTFMTSVEANAWHYWWLISGNTTGNEGLCDSAWIPAKRMYTLGNYSRFVRPGYYRIANTDNAPTAVLTSAYKDPDSYTFAIVAVNQYGGNLQATFNLNNFPSVSSVTAWITSETQSLADQPAVAVTNSSFTYELPAMSVVTFVGQALKPDTLLSASSVVENQPAGTTVGAFSTTNGGPGETFTYSLVSGEGSDDNASFNISGDTLRTAASFDYETKSSYSIRVRSTGQTGQNLEDRFSITVTNVKEPPTEIALSNSTVAENQPAGTIVGSFSTADPDGGSTFSYELVDGPVSDDNGSFAISGDALHTAVAFDYEVKDRYTIRVRSTDPGGFSVESAFTITVTNVFDTNLDFGLDLQRIDGFGAAVAFQRSNLMHGLRGLTPENQLKLMELLFSPETGIGLSIVRLGIGSAPTGEAYDAMHSIQPTDPGGPTATPQYEWDGNDDGQVWVSQQAYTYGVRRFLAAPWSAPGYMKTNSSDKNGGTLCGLPGTICDGPIRTDAVPPDTPFMGDDWRQAYANYLLQYIRFYQQEGIQITDLSLQNEPNFTATYASMRFTNAQAVNFIKVLGPTLQASGLPVSLACCDATGWSPQAGYTNAIEADPQAKQLVDINAGHQYGSPARTPLSTSKTVWMTEWGLDGNSWNTTWDGGGSSASSDGIVLANDIHDNLTLANVNAYVYWVAASLGTTRAFVQIDNPGPDFHVSKRLWVMGAYSRYIRPGAFRVQTTVTGSNLKVSAFRNADGTRVINVINNGTTAVHRDLSLDPATAAAGFVLNSYLTDETHSLTEVAAAQYNGNFLSLDLAPRSLTTIVLAPPNPSATCYDDDDAHIAYSTGWHLVSDGNASGGHFRLHNGKDATHFASLTVEVPAGQTGTITLLYAKSTKGGSAQAYIDGALAESNGTISFKGPNGGLRDPEFKEGDTQYQVKYAGLAPGRHTLVIRDLTGAVYIDGICLESSASYSQPANGPGQTSNYSSSVGVGQQTSSSLTVPSNAKEIAVLAEASGGLPIKLVLVDPAGLMLKTADSVNGVAVLNAPVTQGGLYTIKALNVSLGPVEVWTVVTPWVTR